MNTPLPKRPSPGQATGQPVDQRFRAWGARLLFAAVCGSGLTGCIHHKYGLFKPQLPPPPAESFVLRPDGLVPEAPVSEGTVEADLAGARELFRQGQYARAENLFKYVSQNPKNPPHIVQEAIFYEAECLRLQNYYPRAADTYSKLIKEHSQTPFREQALQRMFDIAHYWLEDTKVVMRETNERRQGKRWLVLPRFFSIDRTKPFMDREEWAMGKLEEVAIYDREGTLADRALFLAGSVKFFHEDYRGADYFFSRIHEQYGNSPLAAKAVELAIISKHMSTGGAVYDGRKVAEARRMVESALRNYPDLAQDPEKKKFLQGQLASISYQQAEKDFQMGEFYRRTGHPGSAYFYYELVNRRYPQTEWAEKAAVKKEEVRHAFELKQAAERDGTDNTLLPFVSQWMPKSPSGSPKAAEQLPPPRPVPGGNSEVLPAPRPAPGGNSEELPAPRPVK